MSSNASLDQLCVNTIRMLSADGVQQANSGHPGMPMGTADMAFVLWTKFLKYNPQDTKWANRDRFVLSAGHGSMLLYSMLHLSGYDLSLEDLKQFRQFGSKTPGHPEYGLTPGVECTTGPLGAGFASGVGMALAAKMMAARFNNDAQTLIDHYVYAIAGDGCMMEGITSEAASLAGHLGLGNIIYLYDDNQITIEGRTSLAFSEDVAKRFDAYNWHTLSIDGHDREAIAQAIEAGQQEKERPTLILARTKIGMGSPNKQDTSSAHGEPLGEQELCTTRECMNWPEERFYVPEEVREVFAARKAELLPVYEQWQKSLAEFKAADAEKATEWDAMWSRKVPCDIAEQMTAAVIDDTDATRNTGGKVLNVAASLIPSLVGGSADLAPSTKTLIKGAADVAPGEFDGRNLRFGVREHAMGAICNGMALYGSFIPYGSTFLVFADYMRASLRLSALSKLQCIWVFTHDSIFVGEDGPTHQPVEHILSLRAIPNLTVLRPADGAETAAAWAVALKNTEGPSVLALTRQNLPALPRPADMNDLQKGAYIIHDCEGTPDAIIIGTGSEAQLALEAAKVLSENGCKVQAVSMMSWEVFDAQDEAYRESVLPNACTKRIAIEAGSVIGWERYVGRCGLIIGMDSFGESAPAKVVAEHFGFTLEKVLARIKAWCGGCAK